MSGPSYIEREAALAKRKTKKAPPAEVHTHLTLKVESYEASVSAGINHAAYEPQYGWHSGDEEPVYQFRNSLIVSGTATYPDDRAGDYYEIWLYGDSSPARDLDAKLEDLAERDEYGAPRYRKYRGRDVPIYKPPAGFGLLDKVRGEPAWHTSLFVKAWLVEQWLSLLTTQTGLFVGLHECKAKRTRWVRRIELHTADPTDL